MNEREHLRSGTCRLILGDHDDDAARFGTPDPDNARQQAAAAIAWNDARRPRGAELNRPGSFQ